MSDTHKSIWSRQHSLPNLSRLVLAAVTPRMLRGYFFGLAYLATVIALFYAEEDLRGKLEWESYMRHSKAQGEDLDWHAYVPPPMPDDQNFAMTPPFAGLFDYERTTNNTHWRDTNIWARTARVTFTSQDPRHQAPAHFGEWIHGRRLDLKEWQTYFRNAKTMDMHAERHLNGHRFEYPKTNDWPVAPQPQEPAADVLLALTKFNPDIAAIRAASARPQSRFPIHYDELPKALLVHLAFLANISRVLQLRAVAELDAGRNQEAFADTQLAFYCADAIRSDACMISQIVRWQMIEADLQPIWEGLAARRWSESQLQEFQRDFSKMDLLSRYDYSMKAEIAFTCGWIASLPRDPSNFLMSDNNPQYLDEADAKLIARILPGGWFYQNELYAARFFRERLSPDVDPQTQRVYPNISRTNALIFDQVPNAPYSFAFKQLGRVVSPQGFARTQTEINFAIIACALERFRMAHGKFPESLDALAQEFLEKTPHDIINGQPLKYHLKGDGQFILYSVGWNKKGDGKTHPASSTFNSGSVRELFQYHPETGDWVWQYPTNSAR